MFVILIGFFIFVTISFFAFAVFFPEWVGITGKKAQEIARAQQEQDPSSLETSAKTSIETSKNAP